MPSNTRVTQIHRTAKAVGDHQVRDLRHMSPAERAEQSRYSVEELAEMAAADRRAAWRSLRATAAWRERVLQTACLDHDRRAGQWCWHGERSGVKGICPARIVRAERDPRGFQQSAVKILAGASR